MTDDSGSIRPVKVLVVEDEPLIQETLSDMLSLGNHSVALAGNGSDGLRIFREGEFDIVFTDLGMPGISGWEVAREVKRINSNVRVVMVTGWGIAIDRSEMESNFVDEILPKPFELDHVLELVDRLVARK
jgi:DNA-binding response OmpR family regulator